MRRLASSILVASALLLSAGSPTPQPRPRPNPSPPGTEGGGVQSHPETTQRVTEQNASHPTSTSTPKTQTPIRDNLSPKPDEQTRIEEKIAGLTRLLVLAAFLQFGASGLAAWATRKAAQAANDSAKAAKLALQADRPLLIAEAFVGRNINDRADYYLDATLVELKIRNCGKGPAIITEFIGDLRLVDELPLPPDFRECSPMPIKQTVIGAGDAADCFIRYRDGKIVLFLPERDAARIQESLVTLAVYGIIRYTDIFENSYETGFAMFYLPRRYQLRYGIAFFLGPKEYNYHKQNNDPINTGLSQPE